MKMRVSSKQIKNNFTNIISVGYCNIQFLLTGVQADYYTAGVYGWNADVYKIDNNTVIVTGYKPFGNIHPGYNKLCKKYDDKARAIRSDWSIDYNTQVKKINRLLKKFIAEALANKGGE